ncbi:hypothetical protein [Acinetobacter sp. YH12108]|uniref:hypothetical protein n=1 Tax=Acinetobacter sp. YH12108 TaxID=2601095 RepID=UPI0015D1E77D|nr:hypothetical protein [Acinetobacter sp. YH12108]
MQKNKTIWVVLRSHLITLPPVMTVIDCLLNTEEYNVKLVSTKETEINHPLFEEFIITQTHKVGVAKKISNYYFFRKFVQKTFTEKLKEDDLVWIASLDTAQACKGLNFLNTNKYILQLHELYDTYPRKLESIKLIAQKAYKVVVPEPNRAGILQVWLKLKKRPFILPNKPLNHPRKKYLEPTTVQTKNAIEKYWRNKPIIIYQGHISSDRNLMPIAEAMKSLEDYDFWLLGLDHGYVDKLLNTSNNIFYLGNFTPPYHLELTSYANIGIMSYDLVNLNNLYCAPNKVWEYSGFGIPFIANNCLGLNDSSLKGAGICIDLEVEIIIDKVSNLNIKDLEEKSNEYYESINMFSLIKDLVS